MQEKKRDKNKNIIGTCRKFPRVCLFNEWHTPTQNYPHNDDGYIKRGGRERWEEDKRERLHRAESCLFPGWPLTGGRCFSGGSFWPEYTAPDSPLCSQPWPACPLRSISPAQQECERSCWTRTPSCLAGTGHPALQAGSWGGFRPKTASAGYKTKGRYSHVFISFTSKSDQKSVCVHLYLESLSAEQHPTLNRNTGWAIKLPDLTKYFNFSISLKKPISRFYEDLHYIQ